MNFAWEITKEAQTHLDLWISSNHKSILSRINRLTSEIDKSPRTGIGKPELLKRDLSCFWSGLTFVVSKHQPFFLFSTNRHEPIRCFNWLICR